MEAVGWALYWYMVGDVQYMVCARVAYYVYRLGIGWAWDWVQAGLMYGMYNVCIGLV